MATEQTVTQENVGKASTALKNYLLAASRHTSGTLQQLNPRNKPTLEKTRTRRSPPNTLSGQPDQRPQTVLKASTVLF